MKSFNYPVFLITSNRYLLFCLCAWSVISFHANRGHRRVSLTGCQLKLQTPMAQIDVTVFVITPGVARAWVKANTGQQIHQQSCIHHNKTSTNLKLFARDPAPGISWQDYRPTPSTMDDEEITEWFWSNKGQTAQKQSTPHMNDNVPFCYLNQMSCFNLKSPPPPRCPSH